jgi:TetR/AcrR family transcriptional regulator, repressor for uid operon
MRKVDPQKYDARMQEILQAATRCFAKQGFRGTSISDICSEASMSAGHLYHYFDNKEAIIRTMAKSSLTQTLARLQDIVQDGNPIDELIDEIERVKSTDVRNKLVLEMLAEAGFNEELAGILEMHTLELTTILGKFIKAGQEKGKFNTSLDPQITAALLISLIDGARGLTVRTPNIDQSQAAAHLRIALTRFLT